MGNSDAHRTESLAFGYSLFKKRKIEDQFDVFDAIKNKQTKASYIPLPKIKIHFLNKSKMLNSYYLMKLSFVRRNSPVGRIEV